ncbi:hypothetical protein [Rufibacter psychrotolerans]|uniref:hypothetical protein n=1 Tax=Rufibacter psychrotolerans TaxID=2812556 RepID=UPI0019671BDD|nr:hypothetical protein [Rufibacter sp. SYSU D00308]
MANIKINCFVMKKYHLLLLYGLLSLGSISCKEDSLKEEEEKEEIREGIFTNVGAQLTATTLQASDFVQDANGNEFAYTVVSGKPGHLVGYDMKARRVVADLELVGANGSTAMTASTDHWLYIGGNNAHLYRTRPGSQTVEDLGLVLSGQTTISDLVAGKDGEVFGGTYPGGKVFRYHPSTGFTDVANGAVVSGESYARSLVYHAPTNKLLIGVGAHARLVELNLATKAKKQILPSQYFDQEFVYYMGLAAGYADGDRLLAWVTSPNQRKTLVYNLSTGLVEQTLETIDAQSVVKSPTTNLTYYTANNKLYSHDLSKPGQAPTFIADCYEAKDMRWGKDGTLHILTKYSQVRWYNPASGNITTVKFEVPPQPYDIQTIVTGPDGRIWSSGYLAGGNAAYDPTNDKVTQYSGLGQAEGMTVQGDNIYFGIYSGAQFYVYDTKRPWNSNSGNPKSLGRIEGQDRPFAGVSVEGAGKLYFGTVPGYGKLGGALVEYTANTNQLKSYVDVVNNQSIISLVNVGGLVIGGTTISGGLGVSPVAGEAKLFGWDASANIKTFEAVPVPGAWAITALVNGPDGNIWGMADGTLFVFDPVQKKVVTTHKYYNIAGTPTHIWRNAFLVFHPSGYLYATFNGNFYRIDPKTMKETLLKSGVGLLAMDKQGRLYTRDEHVLWRYRP